MATIKTTPQLPANFMENPSMEPIPRNREQLDPNKREIVFFEENNPRSMVNLVTEKFRKLLTELPDHLLGASPRDLEKKYEYSEIDHALRIAFWDEYFLTVDNNAKTMRMAAIYSRVCSKEQFFNTIEIPSKLAYIIKPPEDYILKMRSLLDVGLRRFEQILNLPLHDSRGEVNSKLIAEIVKVVALVDNRVKGAVVQKLQVEQKSVNINYEAPKSYQDVTKELKDIEREIKRLNGGGGTPSIFGDMDGSEQISGAGAIEAQAERITASSGEGEMGKASSAPLPTPLRMADEVHQLDEQNESSDSGEPDREEFSASDSSDLEQYR